ncbi:MAG: GH36 C-terminal domain-containing protein [Clostridia bacterium]|nr:GH36 C-terminal domain-containing protein [Clostridia bacterium]
MSKKALNISAGKKLFERMLREPESFPFTFKYGGRQYTGFGGVRPRQVLTGGGGEKKAVITARIDDRLEVRAYLRIVEEFGQCEYTVWFENIGREPTEALSEIYAIDMNFDGSAPVLRGNLGDFGNWYAAYEHDLSKSDQGFASTIGRPTHIVFPYFDLVHGNGGTMIALGWAGTWQALFSADNEARTTRLRAKTNIFLNSVLMPGEKIRTGLVVLLPYKGRDYFNATNLWREWFMKYNLPKADASGRRLEPISSAYFALDTGLPNSDGSISEHSFTWRRTLNKLISEDMVTDFRWFDAGWYFDPKGRTVEADWWGTVGSWELDSVKWPGNSFKESNDACHKAGMKVLAWFEPERVTDVPSLVKNYGYREEWSLGDGYVRTNNIGDPGCLAWTLGRITGMMESCGIDMYREDNNNNPDAAWAFGDRQEEAKTGLPRSGITENKGICGHYALWDGIIKYCAEHGKCTFVDSCASGGGRNDIESMRRGFPMMRSDADRTTSSMRLSQSTTFPRWIPFHGTFVKETATQLEASTGAGSSAYVSRASFLPVYNLSEAFSHNRELDYDLMRRNFAEWKSVRHLLVKDYYPLTPWRHDSDREHWTVWAYDDPDAGESVLLAFRQEEAVNEEFVVRLPFADPEAQYSLKNADNGSVSVLSGADLLKNGFTVTLPEPKTSAMFYIDRLYRNDRKE